MGQALFHAMTVQTLPKTHLKALLLLALIRIFTFLRNHRFPVGSRASGSFTDAYGNTTPLKPVLRTYGEIITKTDAIGSEWTGYYVFVEELPDGSERRTENAGGYFFPNGYVHSASNNEETFAWEWRGGSGTYLWRETYTYVYANGDGTTRTMGGQTERPVGSVIWNYDDSTHYYFLKYAGNGQTIEESVEKPVNPDTPDSLGLSQSVLYSTACGDFVIGTKYWDYINGEIVNIYYNYVSAGEQVGICNGYIYFSDGVGGVYSEAEPPPPPPPDPVDEEWFVDPEEGFDIDSDETNKDFYVTEYSGLFDANGLPYDAYLNGSDGLWTLNEENV